MILEIERQWKFMGEKTILVLALIIIKHLKNATKTDVLYISKTAFRKV